jgi:hypothetical protein
MDGGYCWTWRELVRLYGRATALRLMDFHYYRGDDGWPVWLDGDLANGLDLIAIEDSWYQQGRP